MARKIQNQMAKHFHICKCISKQPKPLFWFKSDTKTKIQIGRYFRSHTKMYILSSIATFAWNF